MKRNLLLTTLIFAGASGIAQNSFAAPAKPTVEPEVKMAEMNDVPYSHWAYPCVHKLRVLFQIPVPDYVEPSLWHRYEFAVFIARFNDKNPDLSDPTAKDILYSLWKEFAPELARLGLDNPFSADENTGESRFATPTIRLGGYKSYSVDEKEKKVEATKDGVEKPEAPAK